LGHLVGDKVLVHITSILAETLGKRGTVARWGGDELMVLLPESDQARSAAIAEELRSAIESIPYDRDVRCTISIGVAEHLMGESSLDLIRRADDALYRAKGEGKNRLVPAPHRKRVRSESR
jgi:diguanylate cyclase (GGDEF)-like protein